MDDLNNIEQEQIEKEQSDLIKSYEQLTSEDKRELIDIYSKKHINWLENNKGVTSTLLNNLDFMMTSKSYLMKCLGPILWEIIPTEVLTNIIQISSSIAIYQALKKDGE